MNRRQDHSRQKPQVSWKWGAIAAACSLVLTVVFLLSGPMIPALHAENTPERKLVTRVEPDYPVTLQRLYTGEIVKLEVVITAKGTVESVKLLGGNPVLGQSAMTAVKQWKYAPGESKTTTEVSLTFDPHR